MSDTATAGTAPAAKPAMGVFAIHVARNRRGSGAWRDCVIVELQLGGAAE